MGSDYGGANFVSNHPGVAHELLLFPYQNPSAREQVEPHIVWVVAEPMTGVI